jgi:hypothetical protein
MIGEREMIFYFMNSLSLKTLGGEKISNYKENLKKIYLKIGPVYFYKDELKQ